MSLLDDFKEYCRDKGKYNVTDFNEIMLLFEDFEAERKAKNNFYETGEMPAEKSVISEKLEEEDSEGYFESLFNTMKK